MSRSLRLVLGDQLSLSISSLEDACEEDDVLMCEVMEEASYVMHHQKKIAFLFSAMRHHAGLLREKGYRLFYTKLEDQENRGSFLGEVERHLERGGFSRIIVTHPGEYRLLEEFLTWPKRLGVEVELRPDHRFLCSKEEFARWAKGRKQLRMEFFYREMRQKYAILMEGKEPVGGSWNFDTQNRKPPPKEDCSYKEKIPAPYQARVDEITKEVLALVNGRFSHHFGDLEPLPFAVTREGALAALKLFIDERLPLFGDYQDAMLQGEPWMYHAHLSMYLNCGLLLPLECLHAAQEAYYAGKAPLNAVEGFVRQILGWREFVRGIYWLKMPSYKEENVLGAKRKLPDFYWSAQTKMNCLKQCVLETKQHAYAHHIQRLMVLGNFALLIGVIPSELNAWFLAVYADAYEWVELPNVSGMVLHADGGFLASKPYAAGGSYIDKMSNYCKSCSYKVRKKLGEDACPFNYLYWNFMAKHRERFEHNPRMAMMYKTLDRMGEEKQRAIKEESQAFLSSLKESDSIY